MPGFIPEKKSDLCRSGGEARTAEGADHAEQDDARDDGLRDDAVQAPDLEDVGFDPGEIEGEEAASGRGQEGEAVAAGESEDQQRGVAGDADDGDRNDVAGEMQDGEVGMVDDAAVPVGVDVAGFGGKGVVDVQGQTGDDDAERGKEG